MAPPTRRSSPLQGPFIACFAPVPGAGPASTDPVLRGAPAGSLFGSPLPPATRSGRASQSALRRLNAERAEAVASPLDQRKALALESAARALTAYITERGPGAEFQSEDFHRWADQLPIEMRLPECYDRRATAGLLGRAVSIGCVERTGYRLTQGDPERNINSSPKAVYRVRIAPKHWADIAYGPHQP